MATVERLTSARAARNGTPQVPQTDASVVAAALEMADARGRARQVSRLFERSMIPMAIVDNNRRYLEVNRAARLLLRMSLSELRRYRIDDFTPSERIPGLEAAWTTLAKASATTGFSDLRLTDGSRLRIAYCRIANVLPGRHLSVFAPAHWPADELGLGEGNGEPAPVTPLSRREREVLSLLAAGADLREVAAELTISPATARTHIGNVHRKLGTRNRAHAVATALRLGAIDPL